MAATKFQGWLGKDEESVKGKMQWGEFEPKKWTEDDVDIEISHCGICGSDLHMLSSGWGPTPYRACLPETPRCVFRTDFVKPVSSATRSSERQ
jgi:D-arabinose 1-dehydrogenase-like Zn-dependent alcohol dehydrogenase